MTRHVIHRQEIDDLAAYENWPAISITLGEMCSSGDVKQGHVRLKNLLSIAETRLLDANLRPSTIHALLQPVNALTEDEPFWNARFNSIAIYLADGFFKAIHLSYRLGDSIEIASRFDLVPMARTLTPQSEFNILVLDRNHVRLIHCNDTSACTIKVEGMPPNIDSFAAGEHHTNAHQLHTVGAGASRGVGRTVIGSGGGDRGAVLRARTQRFLLAVDHAVSRHLESSSEPLILAGVKDAQASYRDVTKYPRVMAQGLPLSSKSESNEALRMASQSIINELSDKARLAELERYHAQAGTGLTSQQVEEILVASHAGKVESLLLTDAAPVWGKFDDQTGAVQINERPASTDENLVNRAMLSTLRHHGNVFAMHPGELETPSSVAAIFRY